MKPAPLSPEQLARAAELYASGKKPAQVAVELGISSYRARTLLKRHDVATAVDRVRLTEIIPSQLAAILTSIEAFTGIASAVDRRLAAVDEEMRKVRAAMRRLQVENKDLRETRAVARKELRAVKAALWKARGY